MNCEEERLFVAPILTFESKLQIRVGACKNLRAAQIRNRQLAISKCHE